MNEAIIFDGIRTPFGRHGGILSGVRPDDMMASVIRALVPRNNLDGGVIEDVLVGNTNQAGEDCRNVGRNAALLAGLPTSVPGITLNRLCGSGAAAVLDASRTVKCNEGGLFIAGGVESMSRSPYVIGKAEGAYSRAQTMYDSTLGWRFPNKKLTGPHGDDSNAETAENVGKDVGINREDSDVFALASQQRYAAAKADGFYTDEILPLEVPAARRKDPPVTVSEDEHPRPDTSLEKLAALKALYEGGVVTAGNASGINDGAAGLLIGDPDTGSKLGLKPRARVLAGAVSGVDPRVMGLGPVPSSRKVLQRTGLSLNDMEVIEINEAFATQVLGCLKQMELAFDDPRVNPNGGAIAVGHPLGASGARLVLTALRQLERAGGRYALVTMCIGIGQGIALVLERIS